MLYDGTLMNKEDFLQHLDTLMKARTLQMRHQEKTAAGVRPERVKGLPVEDEDNQEEDKE